MQAHEQRRIDPQSSDGPPGRLRRPAARPLAGRALVACLLLPLLLGGCPFLGGGPPPVPVTMECDDGAPPGGQDVVQIGRNVDGRFVQLTDGEQLGYHAGAQGGYHVYASVRLFSRSGGDWLYQLRLVDPAMKALGGNVERARACAGRWTVLHHLPVFLDAPLAMADGTLLIQAEPDDGRAGRLGAEVRVRITGAARGAMEATARLAPALALSPETHP